MTKKIDLSVNLIIKFIFIIEFKTLMIRFSFMQLECLVKFYSNHMYCLAGTCDDDYIKINIQEDYCYAPKYLKNNIQMHIMKLLSNLKTKSFKIIDFYDIIADKLTTVIKNIAERNNCYCEFELKKKLKSYPIPKSNNNNDILISSKSIIEQSNLFCSSPFVSYQAKVPNGLIEVLIDDISLQKVCVLVYF